jgi:hypothetical protein
MEALVGVGRRELGEGRRVLGEGRRRRRPEESATREGRGLV